MIPPRFFWLLDILVLSIAFFAAYVLLPVLVALFVPGAPLRTEWLETWFSPQTSFGDVPPIESFLWIPLSFIPLALIVLGLLGAHHPLLDQSRVRITAASIGTSFVALSLVTLVQFALKTPEGSRLLVFTFTLFSGIGLAAYRLVLWNYFTMRRRAGYYARNVLLIGLPFSIEWMANYFTKHVPQTDYALLGYLNASCSKSVSERQPTIADLRWMGTVEQLGELLIHRPIHEVIAVQPSTSADWMRQVIRECDYFGVVLRIVPEALLFGEHKGLDTLYPLEPLHLPAVVLAPHNWDGHSEALFIKRLFDLTTALIALMFLAPLFLIVAVAIKLTTPQLPILYRWCVVGRNGVEFVGYKFTTMWADADERKPELAAQNEMSGPVFKIKNDPRITPLGHFLRKFSINELPQLWSVVKGDMSLVGPRPAFRHELERYEFWHKRKLSIRPGITCLWQIRGRNKVADFDEWVKMDLEYIDNWSLWLDIKILFRTLWVVVAGTGS
jgi:exopolysaccharide biosynthesis polyprenyl glycosylphosphotransferase